MMGHVSLLDFILQRTGQDMCIISVKAVAKLGFPSLLACALNFGDSELVDRLDSFDGTTPTSPYTTLYCTTPNTSFSLIVNLSTCRSCTQ